jgi:hypothetical protein
MGTGGYFPGGKSTGREADNSSPSRVEDKNAWRYTSNPQYIFMAWCLVKHMDTLTFTFYIFIVTNPPNGDCMVLYEISYQVRDRVVPVLN